MISEVWTSIDGAPAELMDHDGDQWTFAVPSYKTGYVVAEVWAEDHAGNQAYRAAILTFEKGTIKEVRWLPSGCDCVMLPHEVCEVECYATVLSW